mmetsp:Transcript_6099/g.13772  ORF Transcript_6099/g.13772 Transcript_6099/m.13772 type:complete len:236 (-) Transcript_6099:1702-2409(-)
MTSWMDSTRRCSVASSGLSLMVTSGSWERDMISVSDIECFWDKLIVLLSGSDSSPSTIDGAMLLMSSKTESLSPSFAFETKPIRRDPTSGSISHIVRFSRRVNPFRVDTFGINRCTVTPPYKNFLNFVSNKANRSASSLLSVDKNANAGNFSGDLLPPDDRVSTISPLHAATERSYRQSFMESLRSISGALGSSCTSCVYSTLCNAKYRSSAQGGGDTCPLSISLAGSSLSIANL